MSGCCKDPKKEEIRCEKIRKAMMGKKYSLGYKHSQATRMKMSMHKPNVGIQQGEKNHAHKLTEKEVLEIRNSNFNSTYLMDKYEISRTHVNAIKRLEVWKHI